MLSERLRRIVKRGAAVGLSAAIAGTPVTAGEGAHQQQAIIERIKSGILFSSAELNIVAQDIDTEYPQEASKLLRDEEANNEADYQIFQKIIEQSLNQEVMGQFLNNMRDNVSEDPEKHIKFVHEERNGIISDRDVYIYGGLDLIVFNPKTNPNGPFAFMLGMNMNKSFSLEGHPDVVFPSNIFTSAEQRGIASSVFAPNRRLQNELWLPRQLYFDDGISGNFRVYRDELNRQHSHETRVDGVITLVGVYTPLYKDMVESNFKSPLNPSSWPV